MPTPPPRPSNRPLRSTADTPLARLRLASGQTQFQIAMKAGVSLATYCRLEHAEHKRGAWGETLTRVAAALGCEVSVLFTDTGRVPHGTPHF